MFWPANQKISQNPFWISHITAFFLIQLKLKWQIHWYTPVNPWKAWPDSRPHGQSLYLSSDQNNALWVSTYLTNLYKGVPPHTDTHTQRFLFPVFTVSARTTQQSFCVLNTKKKTACRLRVSLLTQARLISQVIFRYAIKNTINICTQKQTQKQTYLIQYHAVIAPMKDFFPAKTSDDFVHKKLARGLWVKADFRKEKERKKENKHVTLLRGLLLRATFCKYLG